MGDKGEGLRWLSVLKTKCINKSTVGEQFEDQASIRFSPLVIRGAIFEALLAKDFVATPKPDNFDEVKSVSYASPATQASGKEATYALAMDIGECTVRKATAASYALLETEIGTKDEMAATNSLVPAIGSCTPSGVTMEFSLSVIRGMVAEPMYRLTKAKLDGQK